MADRTTTANSTVGRRQITSRLPVPSLVRRELPPSRRRRERLYPLFIPVRVRVKRPGRASAPLCRLFRGSVERALHMVVVVGRRNWPTGERRVGIGHGIGSRAVRPDGRKWS